MHGADNSLLCRLDDASVRILDATWYMPNAGDALSVLASHQMPQADIGHPTNLSGARSVDSLLSDMSEL